MKLSNEHGLQDLLWSCGEKVANVLGMRAAAEESGDVVKLDVMRPEWKIPEKVNGAPRPGKHLRITVTKYVRAPALLVCELWSAVDPLPGYCCVTCPAHCNNGPQDVWTLGIESRATTEIEPEMIGNTSTCGVTGMLSSGRVSFVSHKHICRLILSLEFAIPENQALEELIANHVALLEQRLDRFSDWFDEGMKRMDAEEKTACA